MDFVAVVDQAIALLRQRGRLTYRTSCSFNSLTSIYKRLQTNSSWASTSWSMRPAAPWSGPVRQGLQRRLSQHPPAYPRPRRSRTRPETPYFVITYLMSRPASNSFMASTRFSPFSANGLPPFRPLALAAASPALDLSWIMLRSSLAMALNTTKKNCPMAVEVSILS